MQAAVKKAKEDAVPLIQASERELMQAREVGKQILTEAAIAAARQVEQLEKSLSHVDDQQNQLQVTE